jgi:DNA-binding CsgD family transcriptional regulator
MTPMNVKGEINPKDFESILFCLREIYDLAEPEEFPLRLLKAVSRVVKAKSIAFTAVDPVLNKSYGYFHPPEHWKFGDIAEPFQRNIKDHPVIEYASRTRDGSAKAISDFLTDKQFRSTGLYREVFKPMELVDQLSIGMVNSAGLMIGISFNRTRRGFSNRDRAVLNLLRPHVLQAYLNCRERHAVKRRDHEQHATIIDQLPLGFVCVDAKGHIDWSTSLAHQMLSTHYPDAADSIHGLPDSVRHWLKRVSSPRGEDNGLAPQLHSYRPGFELCVRYCPLTDNRAMLLLQELPLIDQRPAIERFGFTKRERQVAYRVVKGDSIPDVATSLSISQRTVQKHLERIFRKLGVNNLAAACVKILKSKRK